MPNGAQSPAAAAVAAAMRAAVPLVGKALEAQRLLELGRNVVLYGPPGTGKTYAALQVRERWLDVHGPESVTLTTFHPSYAYEDFIEGFRPDPANPALFTLSDGVLLEASRKAVNQPHLLVIDEINRGDVARILGEVITYLERDKRGLPFTTALNRTTVRRVPDPLYVLGTMNTADKSVSLIDVALRRRFTFIPCGPDSSIYTTNKDWVDAVLGVDVGDILDAVNRRLLAVGVERDRLVGHAILGVAASDPSPKDSLFDRIRYDLLPLVEEYVFNDLDLVREVLPGLLEEDGQPAANVSADLLKNLAQFEPAAMEEEQNAGETSDGDRGDVGDDGDDGGGVSAPDQD